MANIRPPSAQLLRSMRKLTAESTTRRTTRWFASSHPLHVEEIHASTSTTSFYQNPDPATVFVPRLERRLIKSGNAPIGSRRRRAALANSPGVPFDQLPYQCFQEARQILIADREEKLQRIETERKRIARLQDQDAATIAGGEAQKQRRLRSMEAELEHLKILADINDPNVKRRFEDGQGDMSKPIYRFLADRKWREYRRKILVQRISQLKVVPDVIPHIDPILDIKIVFGRKITQPGDFVETRVSKQACNLVVQSFERGEKLVTIAVVDSDVPNIGTDSFDSCCHFLAANIPILPTSPLINLTTLSTEGQVMLPWTAPFAQKGSPYHRLSIVVLQQKDNVPVDLTTAMKKVQRDGFSLRSFLTRHMLTPIGATLFRTQWDDSTAAVMAELGIDGANVELKRRKVEPLPYKRRNPSTFR